VARSDGGLHKGFFSKGVVSVVGRDEPDAPLLRIGERQTPGGAVAATPFQKGALRERVQTFIFILINLT